VQGFSVLINTIQKILLRSSKKRGAGILRLCRKDKTDFTRFLSVSVLFATKKHSFSKKLSTPAVLLPNRLFTGFCLSFSLLSPSFLEPLYKQAFQRIGRGKKQAPKDPEKLQEPAEKKQKKNPEKERAESRLKQTDKRLKNKQKQLSRQAGTKKEGAKKDRPPKAAAKTNSQNKANKTYNRLKIRAKAMTS
jgi:hypothetical protein